MLQIRDPGHRRQRKAPAEEGGGLERDVDPLPTEQCERGGIDAGRERPCETGRPVRRVERRIVDDPGPGKSGDGRQPRGLDIVSDEKHRLQIIAPAARKRGDHVEHVMPAAEPMLPADRRDRDAHHAPSLRRLRNHWT